MKETQEFILKVLSGISTNVKMHTTCRWIIMHEKCKHSMVDGFDQKMMLQSCFQILGAVQDLPANQHSQSSPLGVKLGWIGCAVQLVDPKQPLKLSFCIKNVLAFFKHNNSSIAALNCLKTFYELRTARILFQGYQNLIWYVGGSNA